MADISSFLDDSESDTSDVEIKDISVENEESVDEAQTTTQMALDDMENNTDRIIRVEELFAEQLKKENDAKKHLPSVNVENKKSLAFDLGNLCCYDPSSIDFEECFKWKKDSNSSKSAAISTPIPFDQTQYEIRKLKEKYLYSLTRDNVQGMVNKLYSLKPVKTGPNDDPGVVVNLPPMKLRFPRSKPVPEAAPLTRWEKFAAKKGIRSSKKTKDLLQWDESTKEWKKKYGYKKANNPMDAPIFEHKDNDFDKKDPWTKMEKEKKKRIAINKENKMRNLSEALGDRVNGTLDLQSAMNWNKHKNKSKVGQRAVNEQSKEKKQKYGHLNVSLKVAQHSTGSMGKFDKLNRNEPKPTFKKNRKKAVDYMQTNENTKVQQFRHGKESFAHKERDKQKEILFNIFGKQQNDAFNMEKAAKHEQFVIERKRAGANRNRSRKKK